MREWHDGFTFTLQRTWVLVPGLLLLRHDSAPSAARASLSAIPSYCIDTTTVSPTRLTARRPRRTSLLYDKTLVKNKQTYKNTVHVTMFSADICGIIIIYVWWFVLGYDLWFITGATVIIYATLRHINCPVYELEDIFWSVGNGSMLSMASLT